MPFKGTRVIHPAFETHHRPVAEGGMTATATVLRYDHSDGVWDAETMRTSHPDPEPVWFGPVRLQRQSAAERPVWIGDRQVIIRTYLVAFPHGVPEFRINDEVRFGGTDDAELPDQRLWMHDVWFGSELWQRDTVCQNAPRTQR